MVRPAEPKVFTMWSLTEKYVSSGLDFNSSRVYMSVLKTSKKLGPFYLPLEPLLVVGGNFLIDDSKKDWK